MIEEPQLSAVKLFENIKEFGELAGFHINFNKIKIICINMRKEEENQVHIISKCEVVKSVKYLGNIVAGKNVAL